MVDAQSNSQFVRHTDRACPIIALFDVGRLTDGDDMSLEDRAAKAYQAKEAESKAREEEGQQQRKRRVQGLLDEEWCPRMSIKENPRIGDLERIPGTNINQRLTTGYPFTVEGHKFYCDFYNGLVVYLDGFFDRDIRSLDELGQKLEQKRASEGRQQAD